MTQAVKNELLRIYNNKELHNTYVEFEGRKYLYNSAENKFRVREEQPSGTIDKYIGFMAFGRLMLVAH